MLTHHAHIWRRRRRSSSTCARPARHMPARRGFSVVTWRPMLYTIGHSAQTAEQLTAALRRHGVTLLVDVRSFPGSRRNPDVSKEAMPGWLRAAGIDYRHEPELGGRRKPPASPGPRDQWWENPQFANYAAHTRTPGFHAACERLLREAEDCDVAVMCGEPLWWRCH